MKGMLFILLVTIFGVCIACDTCENSGNEVYIFPKLPSQPPMTNEQIDAYYQLPEHVKKCLSTPALIETCLTYPQIDLVFAWVNLQTGYKHVESIFNGIQELDNRKDKALKLLDKYQSMDPNGYDTSWAPAKIGQYTFNFVYIELMLGQYEFLFSLNTDEKVVLLEECQKKYLLIKNDSEIYGVPAGTSIVCFVMARMMLNDNFKPLVDMYNSNEEYFKLVEFASSFNTSVNESVYLLSQQYFLTIKKE
jgi:hypothetical protein